MTIVYWPNTQNNAAIEQSDMFTFAYSDKAIISEVKSPEPLLFGQDLVEI